MRTAEREARHSRLRQHGHLPRLRPDLVLLSARSPRKASIRRRPLRFRCREKQSRCLEPGTGASGAPMTLAIILVIAAALALVFILGVTRLPKPADFRRRRSRNPDSSRLMSRPFAILSIPRKTTICAGACPLPNFALVRRERLRAMAAYVQVGGKKCRQSWCALVRAALTAGDAQTAEAARRLVDNALLLRRNATFALAQNLHCSGLAELRPGGAPVLHGYEAVEWFRDAAGQAAESRCPGTHFSDVVIQCD